MRLLRIEIEEFGKLSDKLFLFGEGMNLIEGANESGKSTLLAFIRFAFYGFPRKAAGLGEEREMRLSWRGQRAAGRLVLRTSAGDFCIARAVTRQGSAAREAFCETLSVTALGSGAEVALDGMTPGEYFLGLPATLFDSTLCLRQSDAARVSDPAVGEAVSDLLFGTSAGGGADAAMERLRLARRELQHQKGRGGEIADLEDRITATQDALLRAREDSAALTALRQDTERYRAQVKERREELERVSALLEQSSMGETLEMFDRARAARSVCDQKQLYYTNACSQYSAYANAQEILSNAQAALREREVAKVECLRVLPELERVRAIRHDEQKLAAYAVLTERGGAQSVLQDFQRARQKKKRVAKLAWLFAVLTLILGTLTGLIAGGVLVPILNLFLPTGDYLPGICVIGIGVTALFLCFSLVLFLFACRYGRRARAWMLRLGVKQPHLFRTYLEQSAAEAQSAEAHRTLLAEIEGVYAQRLSALAQAEARVQECLGSAGIAIPENLDEAPALLCDWETRARAADAALTAAKLEWERAAAAWEALAQPLAGKNESDLRARFVGVGVNNVEELRRKQAFLRETLAGLERKQSDAERREAALAATAKDPFATQSELAAVRARHKSARRRLSALELALEGMQEAVKELREGLLPKLCQKASAHMDALTGGAYQVLYPAADLSLSLESEKGPLPLSHFSAGCRDAAHLSLRLGLLDTLAKERLPLLFDEALSRLDDDRAYALLQLLVAYCDAGGQCLLFTCHKREAAFLADKEFTHFELQ